MTNEINTYARRWVLGGGLFNCLVAFPLAIPFLYEWYIGFFNNLNVFMGLGGNPWVEPVDGTNVLFLNTSGLALFLVGMILIYASNKIVDRIEIVLFNGSIRFIWAITAIYYINEYNLINLLYLIVAIDFLLAVKFCGYYFKINREYKKSN